MWGDHLNETWGWLCWAPFSSLHSFGTILSGFSQPRRSLMNKVLIVCQRKLSCHANRSISGMHINHQPPAGRASVASRSSDEETQIPKLPDSGISTTNSRPRTEGVGLVLCPCVQIDPVLASPIAHLFNHDQSQQIRALIGPTMSSVAKHQQCSFAEPKRIRCLGPLTLKAHSPSLRAHSSVQDCS